MKRVVIGTIIASAGLLTILAFVLLRSESSADEVVSGTTEHVAACDDVVEGSTDEAASALLKFCNVSFQARYRINNAETEGLSGAFAELGNEFQLTKHGGAMRMDFYPEDEGAFVSFVASSLFGEDAEYSICVSDALEPFSSIEARTCIADEGDTAGMILLGMSATLLAGQAPESGGIEGDGERSYGGVRGVCFKNVDRASVEGGFCVTAEGIPLYSRQGDFSIEAVAVAERFSPDDVRPPFATLPRSPEPTPDYSDYEAPTRVPPIAVEIRLRPSGSVTADDVAAISEVLNRRIELGPGCAIEIPIDPDRPCATVTFSGGEFAVAFNADPDEISEWSDSELGTWLTSTGARSDRRVFICEPMLDDAGRIAMVDLEAGEAIEYGSTGCDAVMQDGQFRIVDGDGNVRLSAPAYVDRRDADPSETIWVPAGAIVDGTEKILTSEYMRNAYTDAPFGTDGTRLVYNLTDEGEVLSNAIAARLAPSVLRQPKSDDDQYHVAVFVDGVPLRNLHGAIATGAIFRENWLPDVISLLSPEESRRAAGVINSQMLAVPLDVVSITKSPTTAP
jgi:hypothetical protein